MSLVTTQQVLASSSGLNYASAMMRLTVLLGIFGLATCGPSSLSSVERSPHTVPKRIVSLDFCADQYVLKMVDPERILAVSPDADANFSFMKESAKDLKSVRSNAEDVLALKPDLVVRSYGGGPNAAAFFERAGIPVLNVGWAGDIDGIKRVTAEMAAGLGAADVGAQIIEDFEARLERLETKRKNNMALYMTPSGTTTGEGSLVHEILEAAGLENFEEKPGWRTLPLERLVYEQPNLIAAAFFDTNSFERDSWSAMRHPVARTQISDLPTVVLSGSWMSCGGWFAIEAIEALAGQNDKEGAL